MRVCLLMSIARLCVLIYRLARENRWRCCWREERFRLVCSMFLLTRSISQRGGWGDGGMVFSKRKCVFFLHNPNKDFKFMSSKFISNFYVTKAGLFLSQLFLLLLFFYERSVSLQGRTLSRLQAPQCNQGGNAARHPVG